MLWFVTKLDIAEPRICDRHGKSIVLPPGTYTYLFRVTEGSLQREPPGELVMEDTPFELRTHLGFVMHAFGNVLVTGLGLGCVVRGLLANPNVQHVTCIENSPDVLKLVGPHMPSERLTIVEDDAFRWVAKNSTRFDCAWHDLWTNRDAGEPHLDFWHMRLLLNCRHTVTRQGAWALNRVAKQRLLKKYKFPWIG